MTIRSLNHANAASASLNSKGRRMSRLVSIVARTDRYLFGDAQLSFSLRVSQATNTSNLGPFSEVFATSAHVRCGGGLIIALGVANIEFLGIGEHYSVVLPAKTGHLI